LYSFPTHNVPHSIASANGSKVDPKGIDQVSLPLPALVFKISFLITGCLLNLIS